ncbi:MAG: bifunctional 5,10-methylenetetrahydrofolate dehydrogenase/5,10-methenyltetrahydrofolate cyclohydrolase [Candidatus Daviesbacteria bacterium]|nr:bifunctional 5,10-methylenetetrahydrofolate dehydrogenase/5,10-methenyltetrahydrofolate cyclohydrolase [Candidatus Daviesbacteria bacterium]
MDFYDRIIDGRALAKKYEESLKIKVKSLKRIPKVISILVGSDPASLLYSQIKKKKAAEIGIDFDFIQFPAEEKYEVVEKYIKDLNDDLDVSGIMIQLPLPKMFLGDKNEDELVSTINPHKDVDGLRSDSLFIHATVRAVLTIFKEEEIEVGGKVVAVVGATGMVGTPMVYELKKRGAEVIPIHSKTRGLEGKTKEADIIISAVGIPNLITEDMVKEGVVVIDVGMDVDFENVSKKAFKITPPKGGVGPVTVISLMENVFDAACHNPPLAI